MLKSCLCFITTVFVAGSLPHFTIAEEPHEVWLKYIEGTWTWNDEDRGKVTIDSELHADGKCVLSKGKDETGTFVAIIGWEAGTKTLTDTGFHSNGGSGRI